MVLRAGPYVRAPYAECPLGQGRAARGAARVSRSRSRRRNAVHPDVRARADRNCAPSRVRGWTAPHAARRDRWRDAPPLLFVLVFAGLWTSAGDHRQAHGRGRSSPGTFTNAFVRVTRSSRRTRRASSRLRRNRHGSARLYSSRAASGSRRSSASPRHCCARSRRAARFSSAAIAARTRSSFASVSAHSRPSSRRVSSYDTLSTSRPRTGAAPLALSTERGRCNCSARPTPTRSTSAAPKR